MFGSNIGELHVDILSENGEFIDVVSPISGDQGNQWRLLEVDLTPYLGDIINIKFRGSIGNGTRADMAIDAINISASMPSSVNDVHDLASEIKIYPNPATSNFTVQFPQQLANKKVSIKLTNTLGQSFSEIEQKRNTENLPIDISKIKSGVYFVAISGEGFEITRKIIKQ